MCGSCNVVEETKTLDAENEDSRLSFRSLERDDDDEKEEQFFTKMNMYPPLTLISFIHTCI